MAIILGIDPGSRVTGYGVIRQQGTASACISAAAVIRTQVDDLPSRLGKIYAGVSEIITPVSSRSCFAIEQVFMAKMPIPRLKLGQARGVAILAAGE